MTEIEWLLSDDLQAMLLCLRGVRPLSDYKLGLWAKECRKMGFCSVPRRSSPAADAEHLSRCISLWYNYPV